MFIVERETKFLYNSKLWFFFASFRQKIPDNKQNFPKFRFRYTFAVKRTLRNFMYFVQFPIFRDRGYDVAEFIGIPQKRNWNINRKTINTPKILYKISYYYNLYCFDSISLVCGFSIKILGERRKSYFF